MTKFPLLDGIGNVDNIGNTCNEDGGIDQIFICEIHRHRTVYVVYVVAEDNYACGGWGDFDGHGDVGKV